MISLPRARSHCSRTPGTQESVSRQARHGYPFVRTAGHTCADLSGSAHVSCEMRVLPLEQRSWSRRTQPADLPGDLDTTTPLREVTTAEEVDRRAKLPSGQFMSRPLTMASFQHTWP